MSGSNDEPISDEREADCPRCWGHGYTFASEREYYEGGGMLCSLCHGKTVVAYDFTMITADDCDELNELTLNELTRGRI